MQSRFVSLCLTWKIETSLREQRNQRDQREIVTKTILSNCFFAETGETGENGDPLTIFKNGQHNDGKDPWIPQVEDINKDKNSEDDN